MTIQIDSNGKYRCPICDNGITSQLGVAEHMYEVHTKSDSRDRRERLAAQLLGYIPLQKPPDPFGPSAAFGGIDRIWRAAEAVKAADALIECLDKE